MPSRMRKRSRPTEGAGTLVWVGRFDLVEFALVLEPDEPLRSARRALYAGMAALADALAVHAPPEKPIAFDWPDAIRVDGGLVGGGRLAWPTGAAEQEPPPWLVFGATIRTVAMGESEAGLRPLAAALEEEGFDELGSGGWSRVSRGISWSRSTLGRRTGSPRWRATTSRRLPAEPGVPPRDRRERRPPRAPRGQGRSPTPAAAAGAGDAVVARSRDRRSTRVRLLRTIRLDPSDTFVFERAAEPGEWAVSGAFAFWNADPDRLEGKARVGIPRRLPGRGFARAVDTGADRRGIGGAARGAGRACLRNALSQSSARPILPPRAPPPRRRSRLRPRSAIIRATR